MWGQSLLLIESVEKLEKEQELADLFVDYNNNKLLPTGYRFMPTDQELVTHYLTNKVLGNPIPPSPFKDIHLPQLYTSPPNISVQNDKSSGGRDWFYFIHGNLDEQKKEVRMVKDGQGFWQLNEEKLVFDESNTNILAIKIHFSYYSGCFSNPKKTHWGMDEYRLPIQFYSLHELKEEWAVGRIQRGRDYDLEL